ncbi:MAG: DNA lyase [Spirochaetia bacterium]|jgi:N-glycosylase/DNA lyase|nr:DNA lyase [Spirochaetia bacterium]
MDFHLEHTLFCGQCFCWRKERNGWCAVLEGELRHICQHDEPEEGSFLYRYLDFDFDYVKALSEISQMDPILKKAVGQLGEIHILRQDLWETIIGFILSQNNNIKRIEGLYDRLSFAYGTDVGEGFHAFPRPEQMSHVSEHELRELGLGFRAGYVLDAVDRSDKLLGIAGLEADEVDEVLRKTRGIGPKVSACIRLFGLHDLSAFPRDVWINRVMGCWFPDRETSCFAPYQGLVQQYLFAFARAGGLP